MKFTIRPVLLFICLMYTVVAGAQELSFREQVDGYCQAHNPESLTKQERKLADESELWQVIQQRIAKASQQPEVKKVLQEALSESSSHKEFFINFHKGVTAKLGEWWLCPYMTYELTSESPIDEVIKRRGVKALPLPIADLEFIDVKSKVANQVVISIDVDDNIYVGENGLAAKTIENISDALNHIVKDKNSDVIINADANASAQMLLNVITAVKKSGYQRIMFIVQ